MFSILFLDLESEGLLIVEELVADVFVVGDVVVANVELHGVELLSVCERPC
jgi:hypothetical protein